MAVAIEETKGKIMKTLPQLLVENYERWGDKQVCMRRKDRGIWGEYTWKDYYEMVKCLSLYLISMGLEPGGKVAIIGENDPEWFVAEVAAQSNGGIALGIFTDSIPSEVEYILQHSEASFVVAHDQEQVDKILFLKDGLPHLKKILYWDPKGLWNYKDSLIVSYEEAFQEGKKYEQENPGLFEENVRNGKPEDIAFFCYTSGTSALPKGAILTHSNLVLNAAGFAERAGIIAGHNYVSFLPPAWITEQVFGMALPFVANTINNFPEEAETVQENIREIAPEFLFYAPRLWEGLCSTIMVKISDSPWIKRASYNLFLKLGGHLVDLELAQKQPNIWEKIARAIGTLLVYRPLQDKLGLNHVKFAMAGGSVLSPDVLRMIHALQVDVRQGYGLSECGVSCFHMKGDIKEESIGPPVLAEIRITNEGEMVIRGDSLFHGYYKNPEATSQALRNGWLHTGDAGFLDEDGHIVFIDRVADLRELKDGSKFSPGYIESRLKFSPYIKDALVTGGTNRHFIGAIINIDPELVGKWAEDNAIPYTTYADLSQKPEVADLVAPDVGRVNTKLPENTRIMRFLLLHKEFDPDEAELTRTRKIRRGFMEERYKELIEAIHNEGQEKVTGRSEVTYRDGRKSVTETEIALREAV